MLLCDIRYPLVYFKVKLMLLFNCKYKQLTNRQLIIPNRNCDFKMSFSKSLKDWKLLVLCENSKRCRARNTIGCFWWIRTPKKRIMIHESNIYQIKWIHWYRTYSRTYLPGLICSPCNVIYKSNQSRRNGFMNHRIG